jgi:hypothetical protein
MNPKLTYTPKFTISDPSALFYDKRIANVYTTVNLTGVSFRCSSAPITDEIFNIKIHSVKIKKANDKYIFDITITATNKRTCAVEYIKLKSTVVSTETNFYVCDVKPLLSHNTYANFTFDICIKEGLPVSCL